MGYLPMSHVKLCMGVAVLICCGLFMVGCPELSPLLTVTPTTRDFGTGSNEESFTIINSGGGVLSWTIDIMYVEFVGDSGTPVEVDSPLWLTATPLTGQTTTETDRITLTAERSLLTTIGTYNALVTISTIDGLQTKTVRVSISIPGTPTVTVSPTSLNLLCPTASGEFAITNAGDGSLDWRIWLEDPDNPGSLIPLPSELTVTPNQGRTSPGESSTVSVEIDCDALEASVTDYMLIIDTPVGQEEVAVAIGGTGTAAEMGATPLLLDFGTDLNQLTFEVYNTGAAGTVLNFQLSTDRDDLIFMDPISGTSEGRRTDTGGGVIFEELDRKTITVTINRSAIKETNDGGIITITAAGLEPIEVVVKVEAAPLTIEGAMNRTRPPYMVRFAFTLRDSLNQVIPTSTAADRNKVQWEVQENGKLLDLSETSFFVTGPELLKVNIVLMLDYTGSMYDAAPGNGQAIEQMVDAAKVFIRALPASYAVAVMEYHDRDQGNRVIANFDTNKENVISELEDFSLPRPEHGASEIFDALMDATNFLVSEDSGELPFDDADIRAVVYISDGRDTSSTITLSELLNKASDEDHMVRFYPIAFGEEVNASDLVQTAIETGGHYYTAKDTAELRALLGTANPDDTIADEGQIAYDLRNQVVLTYATLLGDRGTYNITAKYQEPTGRVVEGSFERDAIFWLGDVRAGQISLTTTGISNGSAEAFVRTDYVPRNVTRFQFRIIIDPYNELPVAARNALLTHSEGGEPYTVELAEDGLLVGNANKWWLIENTLYDPDPMEGRAETRVYSIFTDSDLNYLNYGAFGNLLKITFNDLDDFVGIMEGLGETPRFKVGFRADNRIYTPDRPPTRRFFHYPGGRLNPDENLNVTFGADTASPALSAEQIAADELIFDPDSANAWNMDYTSTEGNIADFDDRYPDDPLLY